MSSVPVTLRALLLALGLLLLPVRLSPSQPASAVLCASQVETCVQEVNSVCKDDFGLIVIDATKEES
jgi:hypothetical protein